MNLLISNNIDPYYNLATEEYLLKDSQEDYIFLYVNRPCVVVGKHQITQKEINSNFIYANNISVARRLSGGGTVYHDEGNLNFSYIQAIPPNGSISYQTITQSIFEYLKTKIPTLELSERNDFMLQGKKISGSAMHVYKNRLIAHGTLLIDCNLSNLSLSLKANQERFKDKSISSRKSMVMNASEVSNILYIKTLINEFTHFISETLPVSLSSLSMVALEKIEELALTKYSTESWIFGYSPKYTYTNSFVYRKRKIQYTLIVVKALIQDVIVEQPDNLSKSNKLKINALVGKQHNIFSFKKSVLEQKMNSFDMLLLESLF